MQKKGANISLKGYDDIFSTDQSRAEAQQERVQEIPLSELHPFEGHPFRVVDDEEMMKTAESVRDFGVLTPAIVRPDPDGGYEIVSGHRRHRASELAGKETMPAIVRDLDDDAAIILMVDANLQRESILPSERAFAYKMKLDAIKHQGQRTDLTSSQVGMKLQAMDIVGQEAGESRNQVHRYIRLTELIPELLDMVDTGQIKFNPAVELSYLASEEQKDFLSAIKSFFDISPKGLSFSACGINGFAKYPNPSEKFPAAIILPALIPRYTNPFSIACFRGFENPVLFISLRSVWAFPPQKAIMSY